MATISVNTFKVHKIEPRPDIYKRDYLSFLVIFNIEDPTSLISFNLYNNKNELMTSYKKRVYVKDEKLILEGFQLETQQQNLNPTTLTVWLVDNNNQRISDIASSVLNITSFAPTTPEPPTEIGTGFKRGQAYQPPITEEITVDAPQEITLDSIVTGITQAVTVQEAAAEPQGLPPPPTLSQETKKIIDDWSTKKIIVPNWFANNNINWVLQGKITEEEFIAGYTNLLNTGVITIPTAPPPPTPPAIDTSTSLTMISQKWDYFDIVDGRAKGQITFRATSDFNPYYYGKELVNYMQLVNNQGLTIVLKPNVLRFTQTETDETIQYDEGVGDLKSLKVESYVWTHDNKPMSSLYTFPIYEGKPPGTGTGELARTDFLAKIGGVLAGSLAIALLLPKRIGQ